MSTNDSRVYDVAIVGGGIGGAALAAVLARHGVRVIMLEGGGHPRFAIGESTVPETILFLRALALRYDVPELSNLASHGPLRRHVSSACGVKRNLGFAHHTEGVPFNPAECTMNPTFGAPLGPDVHFFRQDVDAYAYQVALSYGADGLNRTYVTDVEFDADGVTVSTADRGEFRARFLVDAGGMKSILGQRLNLRVEEPSYRTATRTIFNHFVGVEPFDRLVPSREHKMPSPFAQGTLHHLFKGGWAWVIPFDNHKTSTNLLCSVGISLDLNQYPKGDESAEQEFWRQVRRFPTFAEQMRNATAVHPYTESTRNQFQSTKIVGERWCLLPHASDFIDPLFSSGLSVTFMALNALGHRLIRAVRTDDFAVESFEYLETWIKKSFGFYDDLVSCSYSSFDSFELWNAWFRVWAITSAYGINGLMGSIFAFDKHRSATVFDALERAPYRGVQGIDYPPCAEMFRAASVAMQEYRDKEIGVDEACERIYAAIRDSRLSPPVWKMLDPESRCPAPSLTLVPMSQVLFWGKYLSPGHVRGQYFTSGYSAVAKMSLGYFRGQLEQSGSTVYQATRDLFFIRNRDWRTVGGDIRPGELTS
ncbi:NAD(P)/FAD-dependent oxidoreductase [Nocardia pseudovaccinii]|uniref:NAD(P)/FAD-dependent oxidoreductase n=1 Tax=Nocardia pseudovaccinii TaxID=189540 RepID=UPI0007A43088|nr:tryptophan 7-halogenase [Nocardia pseudovaccinii]